jgi:hypothetical protein|tara:strand:- start:843 stop:1757 length:915 start_codon:yes stop_codon:yes gene_type:complete
MKPKNIAFMLVLLAALNAAQATVIGSSVSALSGDCQNSYSESINDSSGTAIKRFTEHGDTEATAQPLGDKPWKTSTGNITCTGTTTTKMYGDVVNLEAEAFSSFSLNSATAKQYVRISRDGNRFHTMNGSSYIRSSASDRMFERIYFDASDEIITASLSINMEGIIAGTGSATIQANLNDEDGLYQFGHNGWENDTNVSFSQVSQLTYDIAPRSTFLDVGLWVRTNAWLDYGVSESWVDFSNSGWLNLSLSNNADFWTEQNAFLSEPRPNIGSAARVAAPNSLLLFIAASLGLLLIRRKILSGN